MKCTITYLDTCLPDYFQGSSHQTIAIPVSRETTLSEVATYLKTTDEIEMSEDEEKAFDTELEKLRLYLLAAPKDLWDEDLPDSDTSESLAYFEVKFEN